MKWVVGIDEVGRGPLAGPVYVCAVAMPEKAYKKVQWLGLTDSKKMSAKNRGVWHGEARAIEKRGALQIAISTRTAKAIDQKGIAVCIRECIAENLRKLGIAPKDCTILLDGNLKAPVEYKNQQTIIKGDLKEKIISLASVVAKVERDHYMIALAKKHPQYHWHLNKGYGTMVHRQVIQKLSLTPFHRKTFLKNILP
jgi:ribonuclease HII